LSGLLAVTRSGHETARVVVLTRYPRPGLVKTRLIPVLGPEGSADLHRTLAGHCIRQMMPLVATREAQLEVCYDGGSAREIRAWLGRGMRLRPQGEGSLGDRLRDAFAAAFREGVGRAVAIGSDCPALSVCHCREALALLADVDVVLGPAEDGGYYLIAIRRETAAPALAALFGYSVVWGSDSVLRQTLDLARRAGLRHALIEPLADIDRPEDLPLFDRMLADEERIRTQPSVAVVIPALNEQQDIGRAIESAIAGGADEVIVADGGSIDATVQVAATAGARIVTPSGVGRAAQMNAGAAATTADVLVFLHADTVLPVDSANQAAAALACIDVAGGGFDFAIEGRRGWREAIAEPVGRARARITGFPYGDQGLFMRRSTFEALGGYPEIPVMEDWELVRRLKRIGRVGVVRAPAWTSPRAWREHGLLRPTAVNLAMIAAYAAGVDPQRLAAWRRKVTANH
jgi:rSAM/selenodomain-associated transferase 2/rSAM/selenodomain-associated transferase 1